MSEYKLYKVTFDTDPGGWKSGSDPHKLVLAKSKEEAIDITIKGSWHAEHNFDGECTIEKWVYNEEATLYDYTRYGEKDIRISVEEIQFDGFEMRIDTIRGHKINYILGNE